MAYGSNLKPKYRYLSATVQRRFLTSNHYVYPGNTKHSPLKEVPTTSKSDLQNG